MKTSSKSTNISISISQQPVLLILTAFVNNPAAGRITVEKIWLRYITIANTTPSPYNTYNKLSTSSLSRALYNMWTAPMGRVLSRGSVEPAFTHKPLGRVWSLSRHEQPLPDETIHALHFYRLPSRGSALDEWQQWTPLLGTVQPSS